MKRRLLYIIPLVMFLVLTNVAPFLRQPIAHALPTVNNRTAAAQTTLTWSNAGTIHVTLDAEKLGSNGSLYEYKFDDDFVDGKLFDNNHTYQLNGNSDCQNKSTIKVPYFGATTATVALYAPDPGDGNSCNDPLTFSDNIADPVINGAHAGFTAFAWSSSNTITMVPEEDNTPMVLQQNASNQQEFKVTGVQGIGIIGDPCSGFSLVACHDISDATLDITDNNHGKVTLDNYSTNDTGGVFNTKTFNVEIAGTPDAPVGSSGSGSGTTGSSSSPSIGCHIGASNLGGVISLFNPLNWLICGVIEGLSGIIGFLDSAIQSQLAVGTDSSSPDQPNGIFCKDPSNTTGNCSSYHVAWASFRDIALGLMLIVGLIILISQTLGFEVLDAYAIRKALPRLLIAAVTISLSWQIMQFAVVLTNDLGFGVRHIIEAPFCNTVGGCNVSIDPFTLGNNLFTPALLVIGSFGIMTLAGAGALSLFIAYTVLVLRQIVVILLIIVAPVAIIAYVLPSTNRTYKLWWESFSKALLMFPLITGMIAVGHVFAVISSKGNDTLSQTIAFFAYFAPYFMLPATFRLAGGAISGLGNFANRSAQPVYGMLSRKRGEKAKARWNKARDNDLYHKDFGKFNYSNTRAGRAYNRAQKLIGRDAQLKGSIGRMGNRFAAWSTDADQLLPYHAGKERSTIMGRKLPGGRTFKGIPGTKRYSPALAGRIANATVEQTTKRAAAISGIHYLGQRAIAGDYEYLSTETQRGLEEAGFGRIKRDASGRRVVKRNRLGQASYEWESKTFHDGSLSHTKAMSAVLMRSSKDKERTSGAEMHAHRGDIATFSDPEEFRFADLQSAAMLNMAQAGRAEQLDVNTNVLNERLGDITGTRMYKALADTDSRIRTEQRHGYGVVAEPQPDGTVKWIDAFSSDIDPRTGRPYYEGETARTAISSAGYHSWSGAKGESVARAAPAFIYQLAEPRGPTGPDGRKTWTEEQIGFLNQVQQGRSAFGGDPGMQREWSKIANTLQQRMQAQGLPPPPQLLSAEQRGGPSKGELSEADADAAEQARKDNEAREAAQNG